MYEYDRPKYAVIHIKPIKSIPTLVQMYKHIYRKKYVSNADPEKYGLNRELIHLDAEGFVPAFNSIIEERKIKIKSNNNIAVQLVMNSPEVLDGEKLERWLKANVKWLKERFEGAEILSAVYHADETTQHIHVVFVPVYLNRLSEKHYIPDYRELHTEYSKAMSCFGYERGREGAPGVFNSLNKYKAAIMEEEKKILPEPEPGEDIYEYSARVQKIHRNARFIHLKEMDDIKTEMMRIEYQKYITLHEKEKEINELLKIIDGYKEKYGIYEKEPNNQEHNEDIGKKYKTMELDCPKWDEELELG